jgi:transposase
MLLADRGYDADWIRELAAAKGAWANIPPKSNRTDPICLSPYLYRARNRVAFSTTPNSAAGSQRATKSSPPIFIDRLQAQQNASTEDIQRRRSRFIRR